MGLKTECEQKKTKGVQTYGEIAQPRSHFVKERLISCFPTGIVIGILSLIMFTVNLRFIAQMRMSLDDVVGLQEEQKCYLTRRCLTVVLPPALTSDLSAHFFLVSSRYEI
jgi:hypothetical protein